MSVTDCESLIRSTGTILDPKVNAKIFIISESRVVSFTVSYGPNFTFFSPGCQGGSR